MRCKKDLEISIRKFILWIVFNFEDKIDFKQEYKFSKILENSFHELMSAYSNEWPEYGFDRHVGYGTAEHVQAIMHYGRCPIHRKSFKLRQLGEQ